MLIESLFLALLIGLAMGGKLTYLGRLNLRAVGLIVLALGMQTAVYWAAVKGFPLGPQWVSPLMHIFSYLLLFVFGWLNQASPGMRFLTLGITLNGLVIGLNHGLMPVDPLFLPEISRASLLAGQGTHGLLTVGTKLSFLADRFFIFIPGRGRQLFSLGDIFIDIGVLILVLATMNGRQDFNSSVRRGL
ncbi:MAG: DUF5317 domain-containing protein [Desulfitobacteriaceae bacterium]